MEEEEKSPVNPFQLPYPSQPPVAGKPSLFKAQTVQCLS